MAIRGSPPFSVRAAEPGDVPALVALLEAYMRETYGDTWHGSAQALERDAFGRACRMAVATRDGRLTGFVAWASSYDLHHCIHGCDVLDLYVAPDARGRGVAVALLCFAAAEVRAEGGAYMRGGAVDTGSGARLYGRFGMCGAGTNCTVGGRAFRRLAELAGRPIREVARSLPERAWNYEA
jgi:GNAT superfamily N-acetyltransferase